MAWHSSYHYREGVACADCHEAHPDPEAAPMAAIRHTHVPRERLRPMGVADPETCYKCHPKIFALASLPSHHPIREGKMRCADCHDSHGQDYQSLKAPTLNQLCFECHTELEGPFVWEHAPVTENCAICHNPHGTVANNLLHQPPMFLCLRCHTAHSTHGRSLQCTRCHLVGSTPNLVGGGPPNPMIPTTPGSRQALFTDCTQCHSQIHGSDFPTGFECGHGMRR
jgi:DmsE family decaheme c-type cytochrome